MKFIIVQVRLYSVLPDEFSFFDLLALAASASLIGTRNCAPFLCTFLSNASTSERREPFFSLSRFISASSLVSWPAPKVTLFTRTKTSACSARISIGLSRETISCFFTPRCLPIHANTYQVQTLKCVDAFSKFFRTLTGTKSTQL